VGHGRGGKSIADLQQLFRLLRMRRTMTALLSPSRPLSVAELTGLWARGMMKLGREREGRGCYLVAGCERRGGGT